MAGELVEVSLEQRSQFALPVDAGLGSRDLDLDEHVVRTMDRLRPLLTVLTKVIVRTVAVVMCGENSIKLYMYKVANGNIKLTHTCILPL